MDIKAQEQAPLELPKRVLVVLKHLPFTLDKDGDDESSWKIKPSTLGAVVSAIRMLRSEDPTREYLWVGGIAENVDEEDRPYIQKRLREEFNAVVIFVDDKLKRKWVSFCKNSLWPLFNSQLSTNNFANEEWQAYKRCNEIYAAKVKELAAGREEETAVWVHDYHLFVLPQKLRKEAVKTRVGYFSHSPFPTSEIFRTLPVRDKLLEGVLSADLIGFQTYHDSRHFLSACTRILALDSHPKGVEWAGHRVIVDIFPVGIDPSVLERLREDPAVKRRAEELRSTFAGKKIITGRDRLDTIKGIPQKLLAFEDFLVRFPEWAGKVVLFQVCLPPHDERNPISKKSSMQAELQQLQSNINELVGRINGRWSSADFTPIHYLNKSLPLDEICALYMASDAALITPLRDGMNLTCHEYVVCQKGLNGPLILSEFAGSAQCLGGALLINPWDTKGVSSAINEALHMEETDKRVKHEYNHKYILRNTAALWGRNFLSELMKMDVSVKVPKLNIDTALAAYKKSSKRIFMLDYDGTLTPIVKNPANATPSPSLVSVLRQLCSDERNQVYVISGRDREFLQHWLGFLPIGLSCEHGLFFRPYRSNKWEDHLPGMDFSWKDVVLPILEDYTERTPGSMIETKEVNLGWHFRCADPEFAEFQAKELVVHLQNIASKLPVDILFGKKVIEIRPHNVSKGASVRKILSLEPDADFVLCIGDDRTDEDMFSALEQEKEKKMSEEAKLFTCIVAKQDSLAKYCIKNQSDVLKLLKALASNADSMGEVADEGDEEDETEGAGKKSKEEA